MATDVLRDFQERLDKALTGLDVPEKRKKLSLTNLQWLSRNLPINNSGADIKIAHRTIVDLLRNRKQAGL